MERGELDGLRGSGEPLSGREVTDREWWLKEKVVEEGLDALPWWERWT